MSPTLFILALLAVIGTALWYGHTLICAKFKQTVYAGFVASVAQWLFFMTMEYSAVHSLLYTAIVFVFMVVAWFAAEWKCTPVKEKTKDWRPSNAFFTYFLGTMMLCIGACELFV